MSITNTEHATQFLLIQIRAGYQALERREWVKLRKAREHIRLLHLNGPTKRIKRAAFDAFNRFTFALETGNRLKHFAGGEVQNCEHLFKRNQREAKKLKLNLHKFARTGIMSYLPEGA